MNIKNMIVCLISILAFVLMPAIGTFEAAAIETGRSLYVEGYSHEQSYAPGEVVDFHVSTTAPTYDIEVFRLGRERTKVFQKKDVPGEEYAVPELASVEGCGWPAGFQLKIPADWASGYYQVVLRVADRGGKFTQRNRRTAEGSFFFVVRSKSPGNDTKILLQLSTNTYNAYNNWGGSSLYGYHGRANLQGHQVSFLRPPASQFSNWESHFVAWAEENGFQFDYCTNLDLELRPKLLSQYRLMLSVGHDEYWSWEMRDTVEDYIVQGGNVAFFSGNTCCWQVRWQPETRSLLCWKQWYNQDPAFTEKGQLHRLSTLWSHYLVERPENELTGVGFLHGGFHKSHGQFMDGKGAFTVHRPEHWVFQGTGLNRDDEFGGKDTIVGYECDGCQLQWRDGLPYPTHQDGTPKTFTILGSGPAKWAPGDSIWYERWPGPNHSGHATLGVWTHEQGGTVFTSGTTDWSHGLRGKDPAVEKITRNVLERLGQE
jgi:hypothetical protein